MRVGRIVRRGWVGRSGKEGENGIVDDDLIIS
jgi:hypothetical protein